MIKDEMFNRLVENGFNFLSKAISELKTQPKYSVINFYAAVELFVKARLMHEHWSLIVAKRQEPDFDKFIKGDFQSVTLNDAANRLSKIVKSGLSSPELESYRAVAKHRNKMVHFFHEAHTPEESDNLKRIIAQQQLKAWYFLHQRLTGHWKDIFASWSEKIAEIDSALRELHEFLQIVFENMKPEIKALKKNGILFVDCPSCGFKAQKDENGLKHIYDAKCLVCGLVEKRLKIECPECEKIVTFENEGLTTCRSCGKSLEPKAIVDALIDDDAAHIAAMEGDHTWGVGNCSECDGYHTVVRTENDEWVCASCLEVFESLENCEWCNEPNTGDMDSSYALGCNVCEVSVN